MGGWGSLPLLGCMNLRSGIFNSLCLAMYMDKFPDVYVCI